jgi:hypothetical protein
LTTSAKSNADPDANRFKVPTVKINAVSLSWQFPSPDSTRERLRARLGYTSPTGDQVVDQYDRRNNKEHMNQ